MDKEDNLVSQVDVLLPFSKIQNGNVTIVDTPGISDSIEYRTMLDKYIPKAVAFIIVIDVSRAGGLHGNMLQVSSVLSTIERSAATKQCFDLKDTMFVRTKWDCLPCFEKRERDLLKTKLTDQMKTKWPWVRESQIFDLSLKKV
nr:uncharacterized protein LOC117688408 [Crassostrea gigas]